MRISWVLAGRREDGGWGLRLVKLIMYGMRFLLYNKQIFLASKKVQTSASNTHPYLGLTWERAALEPENQAEMDLNCHKIKSTSGAE